MYTASRVLFSGGGFRQIILMGAAAVCVEVNLCRAILQSLSWFVSPVSVNNHPCTNFVLLCM
jgi:hypothetical protein